MGGWPNDIHRRIRPKAAPMFEHAVALAPNETDVLRSTMIYANHIRRPDVAVRPGAISAVARPSLQHLPVSAPGGRPREPATGGRGGGGT
jgi:hypothetical protein